MSTTNLYPSNDSQTLAWNDLRAAAFGFDQPFYLNLPDDQYIAVDKVLRLIPKKRMVVLGEWQGKQIVAKFFFDSQSAKRHFNKEIAGLKLLKEYKVPSPQLYYYGQALDKKTYVLIFEYILEAENLEEVFRHKCSLEEVMPLFEQVVVEIATQHVLGLIQRDIHFKNYLLNEKGVFTLDGAEIEAHPDRLSEQSSCSHLALFLSQLGVNAKVYQEKLFRHYAKARGWSLKQADIHRFFELIKYWNEVRWQKFSKKIFRNSTDFRLVKNLRQHAVYQRAYQAPELVQFIENPDYAFLHASAVSLKEGRSSTVIRVTLDGKDYVVKRYNLKNSWHRIRRLFRETRALTSWRLAHKFSLFEVGTAKPIAFVEERLLGCRGRSYFMMEYVRGEIAPHYFQAHPSGVSQMMASITALLKSVFKINVVHGDLKITNFIINEKNQPLLIDLDGAEECYSTYRLKKYWRKDIARFLDNFKEQKILQEEFEKEIVCNDCN